METCNIGAAGRADQRIAAIEGEALLHRLYASEPHLVGGPSAPCATPAAHLGGQCARGATFDPHDRAPVLVLDTRLCSGEDLHLVGSIHIHVSCLLLRRMRRTLQEHKALCDMDAGLAFYIQHPQALARLEEVRRMMRGMLPASYGARPNFDALFDTYWFMDTVVLFDDADLSPEHTTCSGHVFLQFLEAWQASRAQLADADPVLRAGRRGLYHIQGGARALQAIPWSAPFFRELRTSPHAARVCDVEAPHTSKFNALPMLDTSARSAPISAPHSAHPHPHPHPHLPPPPPRPMLPRIDTQPYGGTARSRQEYALAPLNMNSIHAYTGSEAPRTPHGSAPPLAMPTTPPDLRALQISTAIPRFLYFGANIGSDTHVEQLKQHGVCAVLNTAYEIDDDVKVHFHDYLQLPLRDIVEQSGVQRSLHQACAFIDHARLYSQPIYVHCRAGKSRSAMVVMAYLIYAYRVPFQQAYAHVAACREHVSPNIGFIAELMHFERDVLRASSARAPALKRRSSLSPSHHSHTHVAGPAAYAAYRADPTWGADTPNFAPSFDTIHDPSKRNTIATLSPSQSTYEALRDT
ncbi:hypothetical protein MVES1_003235 [Malassezia vespertilionis]|uniref:protein-tyrosine-phosphatase n=1 Tax=Malassezia vespertilionis TaxID=2020962 RepID=A0A2N1J9H6_9BASI|nr:uncharacterized protein MVES1_003235 [Malassezia vespertilionis]PKI83201.1 hypothetical protein MVES_003074 [Malassezia vespertilionis]WFD07867.1 hypothetical protein MVES1_003235 [Malassezia vespertilionis]